MSQSASFAPAASFAEQTGCRAPAATGFVLKLLRSAKPCLVAGEIGGNPLKFGRGLILGWFLYSGRSLSLLSVEILNTLAGRRKPRLPDQAVTGILRSSRFGEMLDRTGLLLLK